MIERLFDNPQQFDFFAAVRLLERHFQSAGLETRDAVGGDGHPDREAVRFRALPSHAFATADISEIRPRAHRRGHAPGPVEMLVTFLGLTGPNGALPQHYTALLLSRLRKRDFALRNFLDLFNHRLVSHFYRAWEKYRHPVNYERRREFPDRDDPATFALRSLVGHATEGQRNRTSVHDDAFLYYSGHFAGGNRSAAELGRVLSDYFRAPIRVESFFGRWRMLEEAEHSRLAGRYNQLGSDAVVGARVWDVQSCFRLRVGPLPIGDFQSFLPSGDRLTAMCQLTRAFVGPEFSFDTQVILHENDVPECRLGGSADDGPRLGWNTWLRSRPLGRDADDAVFELAQI